MDRRDAYYYDERSGKRSSRDTNNSKEAGAQRGRQREQPPSTRRSDDRGRDQAEPRRPPTERDPRDERGRDPPRSRERRSSRDRTGSDYPSSDRSRPQPRRPEVVIPPSVSRYPSSHHTDMVSGTGDSEELRSLIKPPVSPKSREARRLSNNKEVTLDYSGSWDMYDLNRALSSDEDRRSPPSSTVRSPTPHPRKRNPLEGRHDEHRSPSPRSERRRRSGRADSRSDYDRDGTRLTDSQRSNYESSGRTRGHSDYPASSSGRPSKSDREYYDRGSDNYTGGRESGRSGRDGRGDRRRGEDEDDLGERRRKRRD